MNDKVLSFMTWWPCKISPIVHYSDVHCSYFDFHSS
jgi:hypothetical protein